MFGFGHIGGKALRLALLSTLAVLTALPAWADDPPETGLKVTRYGFVRDWLRLGPIDYGKMDANVAGQMQNHPINYDLLSKRGILDPTWKDYIGDEWKAAPVAGDTAAGMAWREFHSSAERIELDPQLDHVVNYFTAYLWSPREIKGGAIYCGADDFIEVFVNGKCVHVYKNERRGVLPGDEVTGVDFRQGWNVVTLKIVDVTHGYEFFFCTVDETGTPMAGYPISLARPDGLEFVSEAEAAASKARAHELGQEKIPPEKAFFGAAEAAGDKYPLAVEFTHDGKSVGAFKPHLVGFVRQGGKLTASVKITSTGGASAKSLRVQARLVQRDQRAGGADILIDRIVDADERTVDFSESGFAGRTFDVPTDEIAYYALEVQVFDGDKRVKYIDQPLAVISGPDYEPVQFGEPLGDQAEQWQPGDFARWGDKVENETVARKLKFWPIAGYPTQELVAPTPPNFMELAGSAHMGLGHISPTPGQSPVSIKIIRRGWTEDLRQYTFTADGGAHVMDYCTSKASLATWVRTDYSKLTVLGDLDAVDLGAPSHIAYRGGDGVRVDAIGPAGADFTPQMDAAWMLLWFSGSKNWESVDIPVLVVLQHKPMSVAVKPSGVTLAFDGPAGAISVMPLLGTRIITPADTADWGDGLPEAMVAECDFWAAAMRNFPRGAKDYFRVAGKDVEVRVDYEYLATQDDWGTEPVKFAPLPFWTALAAEHPTSVVELPGQVKRTRQLHVKGPVTGQLGDGTARYTLKDMTKYVTEVRVTTDVADGGKLARAYEDLAYICGPKRDAALSGMSSLGGNNAGDINFAHHRLVLQNDGGFKFGQHIFENENSMIANTVTALAYLQPDRRDTLKALMMRFMENGTMLSRYLAFNDKRLMFEDVQWFISRFMAGQWAYGHYTGHWQLIKDRWPLIKAEFGSLSKEMVFEDMRSAGSEESNLLYQGAIGYARSARVVGDVAEHLYGTYYATRQLALQQALWLTIKPDAHQAASWFGWTSSRVAIADADAKPKRPALFYWWMMSNPIFDARDQGAGWHATVISPFSYPYMPEIMRFGTERNEPFIQYYLGMWEKYWPKWYTQDVGGWHVYFGPPEYFASRGWMVDYTGESAEQMMDKYLQHYWGVNGPEKGGYEFNNRGWQSLPKALTAIIEASGKRRWVRFY